MNSTRKKLLLFILVGCFAFAGCDGSGSQSNSPLSDANIRLIMSPNESTPLAGILEVKTDEPSRVSVKISTGNNTSEVNFDGFSTTHSLTVLGFRPGRQHTVEVSIFNNLGDLISSETFAVTTDPLPEDFPPFSVTSSPERIEPGVTLFEAGGFLIIVDETGEVVWYHRIANPQNLDRDVRRIANGNLLLLLPPLKARELDMLGNIVRAWHPSRSTNGGQESIGVDATAFHHEIVQMESGNFLVLSLEIRTFEDYPSSVEDPDAPTGSAQVVGDVIVEFAPDGTVVNEWKLLDILDPYRLSYSSLIGIWDGFFQSNHGVSPPTRDWSHSNAVIHDTRDNSIIVSLRHQDAVIKFSRQTGALIWILGTHDNWDPEVFGEFLLTPLTDDEFFFQYHQHAPKITADGNIILFDNGNNRASPFDPVFQANIFSRAVEYKIDESSKEVELVWEFSDFMSIFAGFLGDSDSLPVTGNVISTFGGTRPARIIEVTHTEPPEIVFELTFPDVFIYRAERLESLYP